VGVVSLCALLSVIIVSGSISSVYAGYARQFPNFNDQSPPSILAYYYKPDLPTAGSEVTFYAQIVDDVSVQKAVLNYVVGVDNDEKDFISIDMSSYNTQWFTATIPGSDVTDSDLKYWIVATDQYDNSATGNIEKIFIKPSTTQSSLSVTSFSNKNLEVLSSNKEGYTASISITNLNEKKLESLRLILSPELKNVFRLSDYAISSIDPGETKIVDLKLIGRAPVDVMGNPASIGGKIIIAADHVSPILLDVAINSNMRNSGSSGSAVSSYVDGLTSYMNSIMQKAEERYSRSPLTAVFKSLPAQPKTNYEITSDTGRIVDNPGSTLTIKNISDQPMKNVRIHVTSLGKQFLLDEKNIGFIGPNDSIAIPLISKIETDSGSTRPYLGELVLVPDYGIPVTIPIEIAARPAKTDPYEVSVANGKDGIYTASEKIVIKNDGGRGLDSVRIILPSNIAKNFALSEESFKEIGIGDQRTVGINIRGGITAITNNYSGELIVASEHHSVKTIPISLTWKSISSEHFMVYARDNAEELTKAMILANFLERKHAEVTKIVGEMKSKSTIYILSADEMKNIAGTDIRSFYDYNTDLILVCGCSEDLTSDALYEHVYRMIINNNPSYWNRQKILFDDGNWLVDGVATYVVASSMGENAFVRKSMDAYSKAPAELEWYGTATQSQYGASYTFLKYLSEKYGENVVHKILWYLGSGQISNHRCDTLENCSLLRAVYDVSGLNINDKKYPLNFGMIVEGWKYSTESDNYRT
jgi:hypothetical protein